MVIINGISGYFRSIGVTEPTFQFSRLNYTVTFIAQRGSFSMRDIIYHASKSNAFPCTDQLFVKCRHISSSISSPSSRAKET
jgi:hypothetical protein